MESAGLLEIGLKVIFSAENNLFNTKVIVHLPNVLSESIIRFFTFYLYKYALRTSQFITRD